MSVRQFINDWLERKTPEVAETTLGFYRNASDKFLGFIGTAADEDLTEITRDHITKFRNQEAKRFAPKTVNHEIKFLCGCCFAPLAVTRWWQMTPLNLSTPSGRATQSAGVRSRSAK